MKPNRLVLMSVTVISISIFLILFGYAVSKPKDDLSQLELLALQSFDKGAFEKSRDYYLDLLSKNPINVEARLKLSECYIALAQLDLAEETLQEGITLIPSEALFYTYLSTLYLNQSKIIETLETLELGLSHTSSLNLQETYNNFLEQIEIDTERNLVQLNHERILSLVWKDEYNRKIPLHADWENTNSHVGNIEETDSEAVIFHGNSIGKTIVTAKILNIEREIEIIVKDQVVESITFINHDLYPLALGEEIEIQIQAHDANGELMDIQAEWTLEHRLGKINHSLGMNTTFTAEKEGVEVIFVSFDQIQEFIEIQIGHDNKTVLTQIDGQGTISILPEGNSYPIGTEVTIEAIPATGWTFSHWDGDIQATHSSYTFIIQDHVNIRAVFENDLESFTLSTAVTGDGDITKNPSRTTFKAGELVTLTAKEKSGWNFSHWIGDVSSSRSTITIEMNKNYTVRAVFKKSNDSDVIVEKPTATSPIKEKENKEEETPKKETSKYTLNTSTTGEGSITKSHSSHELTEGTIVTLSAKPAKGWTFVRWSGDASGTSTTTQVNMNSNKQIQAIFEKVEEKPKQVTLFTTVHGEGSVRQSPTGQTFPVGTTITLTAVPAEGFQFIGWRGSVTSTSRELTITLQNDMIISAHFQKENSGHNED
ncbi:InlB B-repeat-containing protein [Alkalihalobacterium bogoriense]|uniref:InlB B-repeat-containing protein n=1 Tax=Alkalihalobacterium bogoriense TaxID=246272 RepID=UPI00047E03E4|nr:tetratricopeptide repeat protein [Alkalihalobacterium bogoriense]